MTQNQQLSDDEKSIKRVCYKCGSTMSVVAKADEDNKAVWGEKGFDFYCEQCDETIYIGNAESALTGLVSGGFVGAALLYFAADIFDFIGYSFGTTFLWTLVAIGLLLLFLVFCYGAFVNLKDGLSIAIQRSKYPLIDKKLAANKLMLNLALGAIPLLIVGVLAYVHEAFYNFDKSAVYLLMPIIFSPILLAKKLGTSWISVFMACIFWFACGGLLFWFLTN